MIIEGAKYYGDTSEEGQDCTDFVEYMSKDYGGYGFAEGEAPTTLEGLRIWVNNANWDGTPFGTVDDMLIYWGYVEPEQYYILYPFEEVTVSCSNGETATTNTADLYVEFTVEESGSYTITATTESGKRGDIIVTVEVGEKFSAIYTKTEEYVDANGDRAIIPEGYAVGKSKIINSIENRKS